MLSIVPWASGCREARGSSSLRGEKRVLNAVANPAWEVSMPRTIRRVSKGGRDLSAIDSGEREKTDH